jgi:hypothetical protein
MTSTHPGRRAPSQPLGRARGQRAGALLIPVVVLLALAGGAVSYVGFVLWPRWSPAPVTRDAPTLPITVGGVAFNIAPAAVRMPVQRRSGAHERIDLAFLWPSLDPPDLAVVAATAKTGVPGAATRTLERIFVTIAAADDTLAPAERARAIYPRYVAATPSDGPAGLAVLPFRAGTPYEGEDLIYDTAEPDRFLVRCTRNGAGPTPGTCLSERRIAAADLVVRFPRDWLNDWRMVAGKIEHLLHSLQPNLD